MNNRKKWVLDSNNNVDIFESEKRIVERQKEDREVSKMISEKLRPIIEKMYLDMGKQSPFKRYTAYN